MGPGLSGKTFTRGQHARATTPHTLSDKGATYKGELGNNDVLSWAQRVTAEHGAVWTESLTKTRFYTQ